MKKLIPFLFIGILLIASASFTQAQRSPLDIGLSTMSSAREYSDQENTATDGNRAAAQRNLFGEMTNEHGDTIDEARDSIMQSRTNLSSALRLLQSANHRFVYP